MSTLTRKRLKKLLRYDPESGEFTWLVRKGRAVAGDAAGWQTTAHERTAPAWRIRVDGLICQRSHLAWFYMTGRWPKIEIDHRDNDVTNDRWDNLREATRQQNEINKGPYKNSTTGLKGAFPQNGRFGAAIMRHRKRTFLGLFATAEEAHAAYLAAAQRLDGDFLRAA